jgi:SAM-dependent methyltransferase
VTDAAVAAPEAGSGVLDSVAGMPPLVHYIVYAQFGHAIAVAAELGLPDLLADGPRSIDDLAVATSTHAPSLARLVRVLAAIDVLCETPAGGVMLTPLGETLRSDRGVIGLWVRLYFAQTAQRIYGDLLACVRTGEPAPQRLFGKTIFEVWQSEPALLAATNEIFRVTGAHNAEAVVDAYDLSGATCVVDVGGGVGGLLTAILRRYPTARGILFDQPHVVASAERPLTDAGVQDRCAIEAGDFFASVPSGGDVYVLQRVIHDWDDARSIAILRSCRAVIPPGGTLLLIETVLEAHLEATPVARAKAYWDLAMLAISEGGLERTEDQFRTLLSSAGFTLTQVVPATSQFSVLEARPV